jgi:hypothetical protein
MFLKLLRSHYRPSMGEMEILALSTPFNLTEQNFLFISILLNIIPLLQVFLSFKVKIATNSSLVEIVEVRLILKKLVIY